MAERKGTWLFCDCDGGDGSGHRETCPIVASPKISATGRAMADQGVSAPHSVLPFRHSMQSPAWYVSLDPGIRFAVRVLHAHGIDTGQSCEGGDGHAYDYPTIDLNARGPQDAAGFAALAALAAYGLPVRSVEFVWDVLNGVPVDSCWRIVFAEPMHDRADDQPMFIRHYRYNLALYKTEQGSDSGGQP